MTRSSDGQIVAPVAPGASAGKVLQNRVWSNAVTLTVPTVGTPQITLSPNALSLVVGETRSIQALDGSGAAATGLTWVSSDPTVATLSTDDPPVITAVAAGTVTITAGSASADVTVYLTGEMPIGTTLWSVPGPSSGVAAIQIAVPNYDAVADVFAIGNDHSVQAITADGTVAWTAGSPIAGFHAFMPDFQGGLIAYDDESIYRLHPLTGAATPIYANANTETIRSGLARPAIHTDGTIFTIDYGCHDTCGGEDPADGAWVVGLNGATGAEKFRVPMKNWVYNSFETDAAFCAPGSPTVSVFREHPWPNNVIKIAGDGYAYLSYFTIENTSTDRKPSAQPFSPAAYDVQTQLTAHLAAGDWTSARADIDALWAAAGWTHDEWNYETLVAFWGNEGIVENLLAPVNTMFRHQCDVTGTEVWQLHLLRVGSDGSSSDQIVKAWHDAFSTTYSVSTSFPYWHRTRFHTRELDIDFSEHIITNADEGALYSWQAVEHCGGAHDDTSGDTTDVQIESCPDEPEDHLTTTRDGAIVSDTLWTPGASAGNAFEPVLQLEGGLFVGIDEIGSRTHQFDLGGGIYWTGYNVQPYAAIVGGGLAVHDSTGGYTIDGRMVSTQRFTLNSMAAWGSRSYAASASAVDRVLATPLQMGASYWGTVGGNPSATFTAVGVLASVESSLAFALPTWGDGCTRTPPENAVPAYLDEIQQSTYEALKGHVTLTDTVCTTYFNATGTRQAMYESVPEAITRQRAYDGVRTTLSQWDVGMYPRRVLQDPIAISILKNATVCGMFVGDPELPHATAQLTETAPLQFATSTFLRARRRPSSPADHELFGRIIDPATVVHEALHNLKGFEDDELGFVMQADLRNGSIGISRKLIEKRCVSQ